MKHKWIPRKLFKLKLKKKKLKRKLANKNSPLNLVKRNRKQKFTNEGERIEYRLEKARIKEALLIERLKRPCKPGQVHEYAQEIAKLSGGIPIQIIRNDTITVYRGKNYVQPKVLMPICTLSKKKAMEKNNYEQSLEDVRKFIS